MPRARMMREMGSRELAEWMAYNEIEPFGEWRADLRAGIVAATIANTGFARPEEPAKASDFMPDFLGQKADAPAEEEREAEGARIQKVQASFQMLRLLTGGKHIHRGEVVE